VDSGILKDDPFISIDTEGVGLLMKLAVEKGRQVKKGLKMGICGEHGGEPKSVEFCHTIGLDYVSCSPFRVPIARFAAAQAVIKEKESVKGARKKAPAKAKIKTKVAPKAKPAARTAGKKIAKKAVKKKK
jgi:pyruvate,orthophosphate dikinase